MNIQLFIQIGTAPTQEIEGESEKISAGCWLWHLQEIWETHVQVPRSCFFARTQIFFFEKIFVLLRFGMETSVETLAFFIKWNSCFPASPGEDLC